MTRIYKARKRENLSGQTFGHLTVLGDTGKRQNGNTIWHCQCDCGNTTNVVGYRLKSGNTTSCGHVRHLRNGRQMLEKLPKSLRGTNPFLLTDKPTQNSRTGVRGVYKAKNGKWRTALTYKGEYHYGGTFDSKEDAVKARKELEDEYWSEARKRAGLVKRFRHNTAE